MPRIELIPPNWDKKSIDGTPTIDVCAECAPMFIEDSHPPAELGDMLLSKIGSTDVDHPSYDDDHYECVICHGPLASEDD